MLRKISVPTNPSTPTSLPVSRNYDIDSFTYRPIIYENNLNALEYFPKDFYPKIGKKYSSHQQHQHHPLNLYRHFHPTTKIIVEKHLKRDKHDESHEHSWLDKLNPFGCEEDDSEDYDEESEFDDEGEDYFKRRKYKLSKKKKTIKKKKKKLLLKILFGVAVFYLAHLLYFKLVPAFYPTTGRDEFTEDNDQLYHEGIDIERTSDWSEAQDISKQHRSIFSPNYDETNTKN